MAISTNTAYDMLPIAVELYDKLGIDAYIAELKKKYKGKKMDATQIGIDLFKYVLKNSKDIKEEVFEVVAIFEEKTVEEIKAQGFGKTVNAMKALFEDKDTIELFQSAVK